MDTNQGTIQSSYPQKGKATTGLWKLCAMDAGSDEQLIFTKGNQVRFTNGQTYQVAVTYRRVR